MQKAVLPVLLFDATAGLGSHGMCSPEISLPCSPSCEGDGVLVSPCGSSSPHFPIPCAGELHCEELVPLPGEGDLSLGMGGWSVSGMFPPGRGAAGKRTGTAGKGTGSSRVRETHPGRDLLTLWRCFRTKGQDQGTGWRNPSGKLFGSLL